MEYLRIKNAEVPSLGLGTYRLTGETCVGAVGRALSMGYRHVDTAQMYGNCLLYTSPSPRDRQKSRMPSSA